MYVHESVHVYVYVDVKVNEHVDIVNVKRTPTSP